MTDLLALDVALLPPPETAARARAVSASLPPGDEEHRLMLDDGHLPHVTLTQAFVRANELVAVFDRVDEILLGTPPLRLRVTGGGRGSSAVWMVIEPSHDLQALHERLMEGLRGLERPGGTPGAFHQAEGRVADVLWVAGYRLKSSLGAYQPHITLGHAAEPPAIEPFEFDVSTVAACHLGRFCTCRVVLRRWSLGP
jgi:2'-5' RNA ligase